MIEISSDVFLKLRRCKKNSFSYGVFKDGRLIAFTDYGFRSVKTKGDEVSGSVNLGLITEVPDKHTTVKFAPDLSTAMMRCSGIDTEVTVVPGSYSYSADIVPLTDFVALPDNFANVFKKCCVCKESNDAYDSRPFLRGVGVLDDALIATNGFFYMHEKMDLSVLVDQFDRAVEAFEASGNSFTSNNKSSKFVIPFVIAKHIFEYRSFGFAASKDGSVFYIVFSSGADDKFYFALDSQSRIPKPEIVANKEYNEFFRLDKLAIRKLRDYLEKIHAKNRIDLISEDGLLYISVAKHPSSLLFKTNIPTSSDSRVYLMADNFAKILPDSDVKIDVSSSILRIDAGVDDLRYLAFASMPVNDEGNIVIPEVDFSTAVPFELGASFELGEEAVENESVLAWF